MKKNFMYLLVLLLSTVSFMACSDDDNDYKPKNPITDLKMPSDTVPILAGETVTIGGKGFTATSEIWFRSFAERAAGDIQAVVTNFDDEKLVFTVADTTQGVKEIILKQSGIEYILGRLTFELKPQIKGKKIISVTSVDGEYSDAL